jgi:ABC-type amino acid transport substrate-binding protein
MDQIPYGYKNEKGNDSGVLFDILNAIMLDSGIGENNTITPTKRLVLKMSSGHPTCSLIANTPDTETSLNVIAPIGYFLKGGILPSINSGITDYKSLQGKIVAVPLGVKFDKLFNDDKNIIKVSPPKYINAMKMLKAGRVDAVAGAIANLKLIAKSIGIANKDLAPAIILMEGEVQLVCSKEVLIATRQRLEKTVTQLKASGEIQTILLRYFKDE